MIIGSYRCVDEDLEYFDALEADLLAQLVLFLAVLGLVVDGRGVHAARQRAVQVVEVVCACATADRVAAVAAAAAAIAVAAVVVVRGGILASVVDNDSVESMYAVRLMELLQPTLQQVDLCM